MICTTELRFHPINESIIEAVDSLNPYMDYKGVSYARKFPDNQRTYERASPFGYLEIYSSSYLHFAPGQSDNAAFNLPTMPKNAYLGLYIDSEGPSGIIKDLPASETGYFKYLSMYYPYILKQNPDTFVVQFGGGISTACGGGWCWPSWPWPSCARC